MTSLCLLSVLLLVGASTLAAGAKDYKLALKKSILFYEAQRSGPINDHIIPWRHSSAMHDCTVGGWYDAGDHVKFGLPMAASSHLLMWGLYEFRDGYTQAGELNQMYHMLKTPLNYFKAAWNAHAHKLTAQVGDGDADHAYWGRPEDMKMSRPCMYIDSHNPGSDIAGETAAAMALGYLVFKQKDHNYANGLLSSAKSLYAFAKAHPGVFTKSEKFYKDGGYKDEMCLGAVWLYRATKDSKYLNDAKHFYEAGVPWALSWGDKKVACQFLLYQEGNNGYKNDVTNFLNQFLPGGNVKKLPCGLAARDDWGSNRYAANAAFLALLAAKENINPTHFRKFAVEQINYILGDNHINGGCFSFEIGYGSKFPRKPHHRGASCPTHGTCGSADLNSHANSPQILQGAVVGGPDLGNVYTDSRTDYQHNEVATDYNSGFQGALAGIVTLQLHHQMPSVRTDCQCKH
ncbi:endoglucanase E-4 [Aplysia californica]|uniref:Endoglucanase n=1 Tax=Aplysia californica TaxID=6500 RepID=A0ABM0JUH2_APLCA|nr:endoglucanase E-4 [Aplysia californica]